MVKGLWNYAIKVADTERATRFYVDVFGAEVRLQGEVLGCVYTLICLGDTRVILFEKALTKTCSARSCPGASCTTFTRLITSMPRSRGCARLGSVFSWSRR